MERIFGTKKCPENDLGAGFGYRIEVYFVEDMGPFNRLIPERFRRERAQVHGGGMTLAKARLELESVREDIGPKITSVSGQPGRLVAKIVKEIPTDNFPVSI
jgi:hypothetical protein